MTVERWIDVGGWGRPIEHSKKRLAVRHVSGLSPRPVLVDLSTR